MLRVEQGDTPVVIVPTPAPKRPPPPDTGSPPSAPNSFSAPSNGDSTPSVPRPSVFTRPGVNLGDPTDPNSNAPQIAPRAPAPPATPAGTQPTSAVAPPGGISTNTGSASAALQGYTTSGPAQPGQSGSLNVPPVEGGGGGTGGGGGGEGGGGIATSGTGSPGTTTTINARIQTHLSDPTGAHPGKSRTPTYKGKAIPGTGIASYSLTQDITFPPTTELSATTSAKISRTSSVDVSYTVKMSAAKVKAPPPGIPVLKPVSEWETLLVLAAIAMITAAAYGRPGNPVTP